MFLDADAADEAEKPHGGDSPVRGVGLSTGIAEWKMEHISEALRVKLRRFEGVAVDAGKTGSPATSTPSKPAAKASPAKNKKKKASA